MSDGEFTFGCEKDNILSKFRGKYLESIHDENKIIFDPVPGGHRTGDREGL